MDNGVEYAGGISVSGIEMIKFTGKEKWQGASFSGNLNLESSMGMNKDINISYHGVLKIGMPEYSVRNEYRYYIDIENADIINEPQLPTDTFL